MREVPEKSPMIVELTHMDCQNIRDAINSVPMNFGTYTTAKRFYDLIVEYISRK